MQSEEQNRKRGAEGGLQAPSLSIPWSNPMNTVTQPVGQEIFKSIDLEKLALSLSEGGGLREYLSDGIHQLLQSLLMKERALYLQTNPEDVGNGFCPPRTIYNGTVPMEFPCLGLGRVFIHRVCRSIKDIDRTLSAVVAGFAVGHEKFFRIGSNGSTLGTALHPGGTRRDFTNVGTRKPGILTTAVGLG